jgi:lysozyme family protein
MDNIEQEIDKLIAREGGFVNDPADNGGATKYGITQHTLTLWRGREVSVDDVKALEKHEAREIYYAWYYIKPGFNALPCAIQPIMLDMAANHGASRAIKILQDALLSHGYQVGKIDGKLGPKTISACNGAIQQIGPQRLISLLVNRRVIFYEGLVRANDSQRRFLGGWIARAESFLPATETRA